ncbi:MAG TPA: histone deacetylase [Thermoanaerobaculia bacterium]|jgi:acetoin utilization deacetylase AcuC-like enzyme|nr:histone deacetylase [Thermoanaerobaculia bacterium]
MPSPPAGRLRRALRRLSRRFAGSSLQVVYEPRYALDISGVGHDARRGERILGFLVAEGLIDGDDVLRPEPMSFHDLRRVHSDDYLEALGRPGALVPILGFSPPDGIAEAFLEAQRTMAGGTRLALELALGTASSSGAARRSSGGLGRPAVNLGGGFHHAFRDRGERFCAFNDVAASIASLRSRGYEDKILVVDLDLHDGDGTRSILAGDPRTHTLSIHNLTSASESDNSTVVELGSGIEDEAYLTALRQTLPPVAARIAPDLAIYLAGSDPAADDAIGDWRLTPAAMLARDRFVIEQLGALKAPPRIAIVLAGGYGKGAWRYPARFLAWLASGREIEPPSSEEALLFRFRALASTLSAHQLTAEDEPESRRSPAQAEAIDDWGLTADDLAPAPGTGLGKPSRFLGFYSRSGVELALERAGLLERLRARGYDRPTIELDLGQPAGDTARLYGDSSRRDLLMEVRVRIDRRLLPGVPLLHLEWLLLQDPRATFPPGTSGLPGQQHPGLGLLAEVMALLVAACDRLGLEGISFVPSYYHLAAKGRRLLRFLDPDDEARIASLEAALGDRPLAEATRQVAEGNVIDAETGEPFAWRPMVMILPTRETLAARFEDPEYERRAAVRREFRLR